MTSYAEFKRLPASGRQAASPPGADRVSFVLTEGLQLKKIDILDAVFAGQAQDDGGFDADVAIATGELCKLIPDLIEALGGEGRNGAQA